jgi:hypothetical protein
MIRMALPSNTRCRNSPLHLSRCGSIPLGSASRFNGLALLPIFVSSKCPVSKRVRKGVTAAGSRHACAGHPRSRGMAPGPVQTLTAVLKGRGREHRSDPCASHSTLARDRGQQSIQHGAAPDRRPLSSCCAVPIQKLRGCRIRGLLHTERARPNGPSRLLGKPPVRSGPGCRPDRRQRCLANSDLYVDL